MKQQRTNEKTKTSVYFHSHRSNWKRGATILNTLNAKKFDRLSFQQLFENIRFANCNKMRLVVDRIGISFEKNNFVMFSRILFFILFTFSSIHSLSHQEDLSIGNYFHLACLKLNVENEFLLEYQQDETHQSYQSFSSPIMNVNLCFRLCRRWIVLMNANENQCFCFYVMTKLYQFEKYLGEIHSVSQCSSKTLKIFSLTNRSYLLQTPTPTHDWSLDGCYYLQGLQTVRADLDLYTFNYSFGMELCRKHCQSIRNTSFFSFFISMKKSCYCLPVRIAPIILPLAVRKPLAHCSFLPSIRSTFDSRSNTSEIHSDTVVKIDVQRYCSPTFIFDRYFYLCLKFSPLDRWNNPKKLNDDEQCSPIRIQTLDDWIYFQSFSFVLRTRTFIWIDQRSTYLLDELFPNKSRTILSNEYCLVASRNSYTGVTSFDLVTCSLATYPGYTLCSQNPLKTILDEHEDLQLKRHISDRSIDSRLTCPNEFFLFNSVCYFVHLSFVNNLQSAEQACHQQYSHSSLVKFNAHEWSNVNGTRFFGRTKEDVLLELFYYQLERRIMATNNRHWLRVLLADQNDRHLCIIRYFTRSSGSFTKLHKCEYGGHPVCQTEPIRLITTTTTTTTTSSTFTDETIFQTSTDFIDSTNISIVKNFTNVFLPDEDLDNVEMNSTVNVSEISTVIVQSYSTRKNYRPLILIITGPLFAFLFLLIGLIILVRFIRNSRDSYSPTRIFRNSTYRRKRYSSPTMSSGETSQTPAVLYTRLKSHSIPGTTFDPNSIQTSNHSNNHDDSIQLIPQTVLINSLHEEAIKEDEEEPLYAMVKDSQEK